MLSQEGRGELLVSIDDACFRADNPPILALLNHLQILPVWLRALLGWRSSAPLIGWNLAVYFKQSFPMTTPAIRNETGRAIALTADLEQRKGLH
jgi:hypothetical protein